MTRRGRSTKAWGHKVGDTQRGKAKPSLRGENHWNWQGGISTKRKNELWRDTHIWAKAVKFRDNYTCQMCGFKPRIRKGMHAHHIWPFAQYPEKRFDVDNGITLCPTCHRSKGVHKTPLSLIDLLFDRAS